MGFVRNFRFGNLWLLLILKFSVTEWIAHSAHLGGMACGAVTLFHRTGKVGFSISFHI